MCRKTAFAVNKSFAAWRSRGNSKFQSLSAFERSRWRGGRFAYGHERVWA